MPFKDRFKGPFKGPFKGRNRAASAEQLEVMQSYNSQETTKFFWAAEPKIQRRRYLKNPNASQKYGGGPFVCYVSFLHCVKIQIERKLKRKRKQKRNEGSNQGASRPRFPRFSFRFRFRFDLRLI